MMDSKQLALIYLMEQNNKMASVCTRNVHSLDKKKAKAELEQQMGNLFTAMKEVTIEFNLDEETVYEFAEKEFQKRMNEL